MNIQRGLKRLWVVGSVLWVLLWGLILPERNNPFLRFNIDSMYLVFGFPIGFWILLYMGFWVSSGFTNNKKKDETK